jgi:hypothetical protein
MSDRDPMQGLSRRQRTGNDIETLFSYLDRLEPADWQVEVAVGVSELALEYAHDEGDDGSAAAFASKVTAPTIAAYHADDELPAYDLEAWREDLADVPGENRGVSLKPQSGKVTDLYETVKEEYESEAFDYIVAPFAGGIAPLYATEQALDADPVLLRYSKDRDDERVSRIDGLGEDASFDDADVLVVDDVTETGSTLETVGQYLEEEGADRIEMGSAWTIGGWPQEDAEIEPYEDILAYRRD